MGHIAPSRERYLTNHPQITIRVPAHLRDEIQVYAESKGLTLGELVKKLFCDKAEPFASFKEGFNVGYGFAVAKRDLSYQCSKCGRDLILPRDQAVLVVRELVQRLEGVKCGYCDMDRPVKATIKE